MKRQLGNPSQHNSRHLSSGNSTDFDQYDSQNRTAFHQSFGGTEPNKGQHSTLYRALISTSSSSPSSSSSASLFSESSLDSKWYLLPNKPQHSVSCSNLPGARIFQNEAPGNMDFKLCDSASSVHHQEKQQHFGYFGSQQQISRLGLRKSALYISQSKSVEGLLQSVTQEHSTWAQARPQSLENKQLYKTTSLGQTQAVKDKAAATVNMAKPKRAFSSTQLPSKGILINKDKRQKHRNVRKARSMEALSTKRQSTGPHKQSSVKALRENFVKERIEFSAFLDEITRHVISPSRLRSFRINPTITSHKLSHVKQKQPAQAFNHEPVDDHKLSKQQNVQPIKSKNGKGRTDSSKQKPGSNLGMPHQHQHQYSQEKEHFTSQSYRTTLQKKHHKKYIQLPNKGTSTSPESILKEKHYETKGKPDYKDDYGLSRALNSKLKVSSLPAGLDMAFTEKSFTMTSPNLENINKRKYISNRRQSEQSQRDSISSMDRVEFLEHYNKDLHENLLQMVSCIENLKADLQCIRTEISSVTEKCKKLEENCKSCQQANTILEQQLQSVIPSNIKPLLGNHFESEEDVNNLLFSPSSCCQLATDKSDRNLGLRDTVSSARKKDRKTAQGDLTDRHKYVAEVMTPLWIKDRCK